MEIGSVLRKSRLDSKMSVDQVSKILTDQGYKASQKTVYSWENGNSRPDIEILMRLCDIYGIKDILRTFGYDGYKEDGSIQLNMKEVDMVEKYRELDPHGKKMVDFTLNEEWERSISITKEGECNTAEFSEELTLEKEYLVTNAAHDDAETNNTEMKKIERDMRLMKKMREDK